MTNVELLQMLIAIGGGIIGAVGGTIGIVTSIRRDRREEWRQIEEDNDFSFLAAFMQKQMELGTRSGQVVIDQIEPGSSTWRRAEKLVERGVLERGPHGHGYRIRGFYEQKKLK